FAHGQVETQPEQGAARPPQRGRDSGHSRAWRTGAGHAQGELSYSTTEHTNTMSFLAFLVAAVVLAVTPGPGIAYVVARTVAGGRSEGLASCFGTGIGGMLHVLAAALGLSLLVAQSALAFSIVKYVGAAYLAYLGIRLLLRK